MKQSLGTKVREKIQEIATLIAKGQYRKAKQKADELDLELKISGY